MQNWEFLPLMAAGMGLLFCTLHYFGLMVVKSGTYTGFAAGTPTRFWGEYRYLCGSVSKNFRLSPKHTTLTVRLEVLSGSASIEVLGPNKATLCTWYACGVLEKQVECRDFQAFRVRVTSKSFCGKFDISLE